MHNTYNESLDSRVDRYGQKKKLNLKLKLNFMKCTNNNFCTRMNKTVQRFKMKSYLIAFNLCQPWLFSMRSTIPKTGYAFVNEVESAFYQNIKLCITESISFAATKCTPNLCHIYISGVAAALLSHSLSCLPFTKQYPINTEHQHYLCGSVLSITSVVCTNEYVVLEICAA